MSADAWKVHRPVDSFIVQAKINFAVSQSFPLGDGIAPRELPRDNRDFEFDELLNAAFHVPWWWVVKKRTCSEACIVQLERVTLHRLCDGASFPSRPLQHSLLVAVHFVFRMYSCYIRSERELAEHS